jgi:hypothetical protein
MSRSAVNMSDAAPTVGDSRRFLESVLVWPGNAQAPGWINVHVNAENNDPIKNGGKPWVAGWPFKTVDEVLNRVSWVESTTDFFNVWVCMSQQSECAQKPNGKLKAVRKAANATLLKSIWIDCDVKANDPKHYGTMQEAWTAIRAFQKKVGLPSPSVLVNSGGGLHIYWTSDKPLTPDEWRPYAEGLKTLLLNEGVKCDTGLTTDIARILRVPGTHNHKYQPSRLVELLHCGAPYDFAASLQVLLQVKPALTSTSQTEPGPVFDAPDAAFASLKPDDSLQAGAFGLHLVDPKPIFAEDGCPWLRDALRTGGRDYDNPKWNLSVLCTAFMENGNVFAHEISKGHADYDPADTQALYERKVVERRDRGVGYPSCAAIKGAGSEHCKTCPHFAKGKSPLNIRPAATTAEPGGTQTGQSSHQSTTTSDWPDGCSKQGTPIKGYANTLVAIRKLNITCKLDTFRQKEFSEGHAIPSLNGELSDRAVTMLGDQISSTFGFYPGKEILREAITAECSRNAYNPVVDYFNRLTWDRRAFRSCFTSISAPTIRRSMMRSARSSFARSSAAPNIQDANTITKSSCKAIRGLANQCSARTSPCFRTSSRTPATLPGPLKSRWRSRRASRSSSSLNSLALVRTRASEIRPICPGGSIARDWHTGTMPRTSLGLPFPSEQPILVVT